MGPSYEQKSYDPGSEAPLGCLALSVLPNTLLIRVFCIHLGYAGALQMISAPTLSYIKHKICQQLHLWAISTNGTFIFADILCPQI